MSWLKQHREGILLRVHVQPKAKRDEVAGFYGEALKIRLKAPPVEGKANEALRKFLAKLLKISKSSVKIVAGETSREKTAYIEGPSLEEARKRLAPNDHGS